MPKVIDGVTIQGDYPTTAEAAEIQKRRVAADKAAGTTAQGFEDTTGGKSLYTGESFADVQKLQSALPVLGEPSIAEQPGRDYANTIKDLQQTADGFKSMLGVGADLDKTYQDILGRGAYGTTPEGKTAQGDLQKKGREAGEILPGEQARIEKAGAAIGGQYDVLISQAEEKARQGRAGNLIAAAKSGGLDTSAWAGISALVGVPAGGPEGFEGIGGKLAQMGSEYDATVADLGAKKAQAVQAAMSAERTAILTGKAQDWDRVTKLYQMAKEAYDDETVMMLRREETLQSYADFVKTGLKDAEAAVKKIVSVKGEIPEDLKTAVDSAYGEGWTDLYIKTIEDEEKAENAQVQIETAKNLIDLLSKIPAGTEIPVGDSVYKGIKTEDTKTRTYSATDKDGKVTYVTLDMEGNILNVSEAGRIGKGFKGGDDASDETDETEDGVPAEDTEKPVRDAQTVIDTIDELYDLGLDEDDILEELKDQFGFSDDDAQRIYNIQLRYLDPAMKKALE